jgi:hypothetical protein
MQECKEGVVMLKRKIMVVFASFLGILGADGAHSVSYKATPQAKLQEGSAKKQLAVAPGGGQQTVSTALQSNVGRAALPKSQIQSSPTVAPTLPRDTTPDKTSQQLCAVRAERQRLEACKKALLSEFVKKHAAFLAKITEQDECKDNQALMLAVSSKSLDDFVHGAIILNHIKYYLASKNAEFINFLKSIQKINYCIQYYAQMEATLVNNEQGGGAPAQP